jgi:hypothetical protein
VRSSFRFNNDFMFVCFNGEYRCCLFRHAFHRTALINVGAAGEKRGEDIEEADCLVRGKTGAEDTFLAFLG